MNDTRDFLKLYPACPNRRMGFPELERLWWQLSDDERAKCMAAVKIFAAAMAQKDITERKYIEKPVNWLRSFQAFDFEVPEDRWNPEYKPPEFRWRNVAQGLDIVRMCYVWVGDKEHGPFPTREAAEGFLGNNILDAP